MILGEILVYDLRELVRLPPLRRARRRSLVDPSEATRRVRAVPTLRVGRNPDRLPEGDTQCLSPLSAGGRAGAGLRLTV